MTRRLIPALLVALLVAPGCGLFDDSGGGADLTIYSGRAQPLVGELISRFEKETGVDVAVRYGDSPQMANQILEEGGKSPADVFFSQDAGSLGALVEKGRLVKLDKRFTDKVPARFRSDDGFWVGTSGRARVVVFNPERIQESEVPASVVDLADPAWRGRIGWAPVNGSFQSFITALRLLEGEDAARGWVEGMVTNDTVAYPNNVSIVEAVGKGEIDLGLVNHYYLPELKKQNPKISAVNHFIPGGDPGGLINAAGVGILDGTDHREAERFVEFLLSKEAQEYFATKTFEYPLADGVPADDSLPSLDSLQPPEVDLSNLSDLRGTLKLLQEAGAL